MNVANKDLCAELEKLSEWKDTEYCYYANGGQVGDNVYHRTQVFDKPDNLAAYDLGFLLRKLPGEYIDDHYGVVYLAVGYHGNGQWGAWYEFQEDIKGWNILTDTPENAAAALCIELIKQDILPKESK